MEQLNFFHTVVVYINNLLKCKSSNFYKHDYKNGKFGLFVLRHTQFCFGFGYNNVINCLKIIPT